MPKAIPLPYLDNSETHPGFIAVRKDFFVTFLVTIKGKLGVVHPMYGMVNVTPIPPATLRVKSARGLVNVIASEAKQSPLASETALGLCPSQ